MAPVWGRPRGLQTREISSALKLYCSYLRRGERKAFYIFSLWHVAFQGSLDLRTRGAPTALHLEGRYSSSLQCCATCMGLVPQIRGRHLLQEVSQLGELSCGIPVADKDWFFGLLELLVIHQRWSSFTLILGRSSLLGFGRSSSYTQKKCCKISTSSLMSLVIEDANIKQITKILLGVTLFETLNNQ